MYKICDYYYKTDGDIYSGLIKDVEKTKNIKDAIKICVKRATDYKKLNENIKLLDYERTYKSEKLAYGVYCIDKELNKIVKEIRVYEN